MSEARQTAPHARRWRALVRVLVRRLTKTPSGRFAVVSALGLSLLAVAWVAVLRVEDGAAAPVAAVPVRIARFAFWLVAVPIALAASGSRMLADRRDGVEALARSTGFGSAVIASARVGAAALAGAAGVALPAMLGAIASLGASASVAVMSERARVLGAVLGYSLVAGGVSGALGALSDVASPRRGRTVLVVFVFVSWALADVAHDPRYSVTGLFGLLLKQLLLLFGLGRIGA